MDYISGHMAYQEFPPKGTLLTRWGIRKGEKAERLPLHSEHRLRRAQDIERKQISLYSARFAEPFTHDMIKVIIIDIVILHPRAYQAKIRMLVQWNHCVIIHCQSQRLAD